MTATNNPLLSIHAFQVFEWYERLLEITGLDEDFDLESMGVELGVAAKHSPEGDFLGNFLTLRLKTDGRFSTHEIPIDYRVPEHLKYAYVPMPKYVGNTMEFEDAKHKRTAIDAYRHQQNT